MVSWKRYMWHHHRIYSALPGNILFYHSCLKFLLEAQNLLTAQLLAFYGSFANECAGKTSREGYCYCDWHRDDYSYQCIHRVVDLSDSPQHFGASHFVSPSGCALNLMTDVYNNHQIFHASKAVSTTCLSYLLLSSWSSLRYANSLMATLNARSTLNVPGRKSQESGDTNKYVSSRRIETFKNVFSRRFGIKRTNTKTFQSTSEAEIGIDIRKATPRSSVLDIRRHSVIYSKSPMKRNSIMGLKSGHQYRDMSSVDAHPKNLARSERLQMHCAKAHSGAQQATSLSFGIPDSTQDAVIDFNYSYFDESQSLVREID